MKDNNETNPNYTYKKLESFEELENAYKLCFYTFLECTEFFKYESNDESSLNLFKVLSMNYHKEHNTTVLGSFYNNELIGMIEINNCYINYLAVKSKYQHLGIGHKLFMEATKDKDEKTQIFVYADKFAINTYKSWGFTPVDNEDSKICKMIYFISKSKDEDKSLKKVKTTNLKSYEENIWR